MAHDALDAWLDQMDAETAEDPTLLAISERFLATRLTLLGACLDAVIRQQYAADLAQTEALCACGCRGWCDDERSRAPSGDREDRA